MRITITGTMNDVEMIAEEFEIPGSIEKFAIHPSLPADEDKGRWVATHVETGFAIMRGDDIDETIQAAAEKWLTKTPEQINAAKEKALKNKAEWRSSINCARGGA